MRQRTSVQPRLPNSHLFVSVARGDKLKTYAFRPFALYFALALASLWLAAGSAAAGYLAFHDDILAALLAREARIQTAYEQRLSEARGEIDRVASRQLLDQTSFEGRMHDLLSRQARLEQHDRMVATLAESLEPSHSALDAIDTVAKSKPGATASTAARAYAPSPASPRPAEAAQKGESLGALPADESQKRAGEMMAAAENRELNASARLGLIEFSLDAVERAQMQSLAGVTLKARSVKTRINSVFARAGLSSDQFVASSKEGGVGGPFIPIEVDPHAPPFDKAAAEATREVAVAATLRKLVRAMPVREPLFGGAAVSSPFGYRIDPFIGRPALHPGVDLVQPFGSEIHATGAGRVVHAGWAGGYGQMVEIDHGNHISTIYGHMSEVLVTEGQMVTAGDALGRIGTTGRSNGPHLHYEVRLDGEPVDPSRFLSAGADLAGL